MIELTLTELIFKGNISMNNLSFLSEFLKIGRDQRFNTPDVSVPRGYNEIINVIKSYSYVDFVISIDVLCINEQRMKNVFVNFGIDDGITGLMLFLDLKDFGDETNKKKIERLRNWAFEFKENYGFESVVCRIDNGNEEEFYFNNRGWGPIYYQLK